MTDQEFLRIENAINGDGMDRVEQLSMVRFTGRKLKEYLEQAVKIHLEGRRQEIFNSMMSIYMNSSKYRNTVVAGTAVDVEIYKLLNFPEEVEVVDVHYLDDYINKSMIRMDTEGI